jgi:tRNA nucleotidyltransferase (CCA-adding enzyme)
MKIEHPLVLEISRAVRSAGGRALLVGGLVRDALRGIPGPARDFDLEVYGVEGAALRKLLERLGHVKTVGEAFAVYKLGEIDISIPRRDSKTGSGHRGFTVTGDSTMTVEEAARRRDFTVNAILADPLTGEVIDPTGGAQDLRDRRLRAVDPGTFGEDSLRVLRAMQFAARFEYEIDPATIALCRTISLGDLPAERIWGEFEKLLLRARKPSIGLAAALDLGILDQLFPELKALVGCPQEPSWHPEGDVWVHTLQAVDRAAELLADLPKPRQLAVMLGTLCHDLGKPPTTQVIDGRIRSLEHEEAGLVPTARVLDALNIHTLDGYDLRREVLGLVGNHLKPGMFAKDRARVGDAAFRRLSLKCELELLYRVARADSLGRRAPGAPEPSAEGQEWFLERARSLGVSQEGPKPLLLGRHVLALGLSPGPRVGEVVDRVYQLQLDGEVETLDQALLAARRILGL